MRRLPVGLPNEIRRTKRERNREYNYSMNSEASNSAPDSVPEAPLTPEQQILLAALVADGLAIQHQFRPEPLLKLTGKGFYESDTVAEVARFKKMRRAAEHSQMSPMNTDGETGKEPGF